MKSCFLGRFLRLLPVPALVCWAMTAAIAAGTETPAASRDGGVIAEVLALKPRAERGDVAAQVALGDLFSTRQQFVEAVFWYRHAATNGDVTAQLALAGCLIAGKGTAANRREAAHWMRLAADGVERSSGSRTVKVTPAPNLQPPVSAIVMSKSNVARATLTSASDASKLSGAQKNLFTITDSHSTRATRDDNLVVVEPSLQERRVGLQPSASPK